MRGRVSIGGRQVAPHPRHPVDVVVLLLPQREPQLPDRQAGVLKAMQVAQRLGGQLLVGCREAGHALDRLVQLLQRDGAVQHLADGQLEALGVVGFKLAQQVGKDGARVVEHEVVVAIQRLLPHDAQLRVVRLGLVSRAGAEGASEVGARRQGGRPAVCLGSLAAARGHAALCTGLAVCLGTAALSTGLGIRLCMPMCNWSREHDGVERAMRSRKSSGAIESRLRTESFGARLARRSVIIIVVIVIIVTVIIVHGVVVIVHGVVIIVCGSPAAGIAQAWSCVVGVGPQCTDADAPTRYDARAAAATYLFALSRLRLWPDTALSPSRAAALAVGLVARPVRRGLQGGGSGGEGGGGGGG